MFTLSFILKQKDSTETKNKMPKRKYKNKNVKSRAMETSPGQRSPPSSPPTTKFKCENDSDDWKQRGSLVAAAHLHDNDSINLNLIAKIFVIFKQRE